MPVGVTCGGCEGGDDDVLWVWPGTSGEWVEVEEERGGGEEDSDSVRGVAPTEVVEVEEREGGGDRLNTFTGK